MNQVVVRLRLKSNIKAVNWKDSYLDICEEHGEQGQKPIHENHIKLDFAQFRKSFF